MGRNIPSGSGLIAKIFWLTALITGLFTLAAAGPVPAQEEITAESFVIMDAQTGKVLLSCNPQLMLPPASTIKIMTASYVLDHVKMDDKVRVSAYAAAAPPSKINIKPGEVYTVRELLYALLLSSANDGARALAERVSGTEECFAHSVTQQMRKWGAYRTTVATANGLPHSNQYSTAEDLALIFRRAAQNPEFANIVKTKEYEIQGNRELRNHDRFLFTTPLARGGKTGYTRASKHTYVGMFQNHDKAIIISLMGSKKKWADLRLLIEKGFAISGRPIPPLEPIEERLVFAKNHYGNSLGADEPYRAAKKSKWCRPQARSSKVAMGSVIASPSARKKTRKK